MTTIIISSGVLGMAFVNISVMLHVMIVDTTVNTTTDVVSNTATE